MAKINELKDKKLIEFVIDRMVVYKGRTFMSGEVVELATEDADYLIGKKFCKEVAVSKGK